MVLETIQQIRMAIATEARDTDHSVKLTPETLKSLNVENILTDDDDNSSSDDSLFSERRKRRKRKKKINTSKHY